MKNLLIEVLTGGIIDDSAYVYDSDGNKICEASGSDKYEAIRNVCLKLADEIIDMKTNKKQIDFFKNIEIGTKVKYTHYNRTNFGYFADIIEDKGKIRISKIKEDDKFSGLKMDSYGMYQDLDAKAVRLYKWY